MGWNHKNCLNCGRLMSADDAHHNCQSCRDGKNTVLARLVKRHIRRWKHADARAMV